MGGLDEGLHALLLNGSLAGLIVRPLCTFAAFLLLGLSGCGDSGNSESEGEGENTSGPAAKTVQAFYEAADKPDGQEACALLTDNGIRTVVRVNSRAACIRTIDGFAPGSFSDDSGPLLHVEGVEEHGDSFDVDASVKGRSGGAYSVVSRNGKFLIDGFKAEEG